MKSRITKFAAAAAIIIAVFIALHQFGGSTVAWADVVEKFQSVPFFSAVFYEKDDALDEPEQIELWMGRGGNARMRFGPQVIFAKAGQVTQAFDIIKRQQIEPDPRAARMTEILGATKGRFSLDTVLSSISRGNLTNVTPLVNSEAIISEDLVVFDIQLNETQWMRIWALRESKLPVHIRIWGPRDGYCLDAFITYSRKQPDEFFDPNAFDQALSQQNDSNKTNIAYAFLTDPGGKDITPKDMFNKSGYHMPVIKQIGMTEDGAFWVLAGKSRNRMPNGYVFHGFSQLQDDLGRTYISVGGGHRLRDDTSLDIFVPIDFPFDERRPSKVTLICDTRRYIPHSEPELIGTIDLTEWNSDTPCPQLSGSGITSDSELKIILAGRLGSKENERLERIIQSITGEPEDSAEAYEREKLRLKMLVRNKQFDESVVLGERLMPLLVNEFQRWKRGAPSPYIFDDYLIALACCGQIEKTKETWERIKTLDPNIPDTLNQRARKRITDEIHHDFDICIRIIVPDLSRNAHLTIEQLNTIFDIDIKNNESFSHYMFWDWNPEFEKPKYKNWERHLEELAEYYKSHPLPDTMEILERDTKEEFGMRKRDMPGIDSHYVENFQRTLQRLAKSYRSSDLAGCVRIEGDIPDIELNHDLVYQKDTSPSEIILFVLKHFGLEIVDVNEPRTVWITSYDGRELKDFREVVAPIPYDSSSERKAGMMISSSSGGWDLEYLFKTFMRHQNEDYKAQGILIINQTGIIDKISREGPNWRGPEAIEMARKWFKDEFGITFTEESREMKTYVIRKRE